MSGSYGSASARRASGGYGGSGTSPKTREATMATTRERPSFRQEASTAGRAPHGGKVHEVPVSAANLQQIEEAARSGLGKRTSLPSRAKAALARAEGAASRRKGSPGSPGAKVPHPKTAAPADVGKNLLGLDFALLAQRAAPSSKNRLEQILQQLSDEISKIASQFDHEQASSSELHADEGEGSADTASAATTVPMHQPSPSVETRIVERLCDKVQGMHSALQQRDSVDDPVSAEDGLKVDAHRLSQLENLISSLQAKVETLPRYDRYELAETQTVRNDRLRIETSELQQQKDALQAEVMQLQRQKQALSTQGASGTRLCGVPPACASACAQTVPGQLSGREVKGQAGNVLIPQLQLGQLKVTDVAASVSPPQSGRTDNQARTLTLPVGLPVGCSFAVSSPRGRVPEPCSARALQAMAPLPNGPNGPNGANVPGAVLRIAGSPPPARWGNAPGVVQPQPCVPYVLHHTHRAVTPSQSVAPGHPDMRDFRWTYQTPHQVQHGMQVKLR
ncbi:SHOC2 [Symbiodinium natans]|uniref:SHOC2 protein n=1 Tax=Symbiodinium natans TaxID=878477 RepID=A0A812U0X1_9DINO|nr:SHOC2 [Symbiodinium natans]